MADNKFKDAKEPEIGSGGQRMDGSTCTPCGKADNVSIHCYVYQHIRNVYNSAGATGTFSEYLDE